MKQLLTVLLLAVFTAGCEWKTEDATIGVCDTLEVSYADIEPILKQNCYVCHSKAIATAGIVLEGYANIKALMDQGKPYRMVSTGKMPQGGPVLQDCYINMIKAWGEAGSPER